MIGRIEKSHRVKRGTERFAKAGRSQLRSGGAGQAKPAWNDVQGYLAWESARFTAYAPTAGSVERAGGNEQYLGSDGKIHTDTQKPPPGARTRVVGGTFRQRQQVRKAIKDVLKTDRGKDYVDEMKRRGYGVTMHLDVRKDAFSDHAPSHNVHMDPNWHPDTLTTAGNIPATTTRIIAHEFRHAIMGTRDNGPDSMNNVNQNENPIMRELGQPERIEY